MTEEFNLSKKILYYGSVSSGRVIQEEDVKEFIKRLKEELKFMITANEGRYFKEQLEPRIDKLAGSELVK